MKYPLIYISITGIILSLIILFFNKGYKSANLYLAGFFFSSSIFSLSQGIGLYSNSVSLTAIFTINCAPLALLIGPFSFLYSRSVIRDNAKLSWLDSIHFGCFLIYFIGLIPYYATNWNHKLMLASILISNNWHVTELNPCVFMPSKVYLTLRILLTFVYAIVDWRLIVEYFSKASPNNGISAAQSKVMKQWLYLFCGFISFIVLNYAVVSLLAFMFPVKNVFLEHAFYPLAFSSMGFVLLNMCLLVFPQIMYGIPRVETVLVTVDSPFIEFGVLVEEVTVFESSQTIQRGDVILNEQKQEEIELNFYEENQLFEEEKQDPKAESSYIKNQIPLIELRLLELMANEKPYCDKNFSIVSLAAKLQVPIHHLRYYFSQYLNQSFTEYKNKLRIEYAQLLIKEGEYNQLSIEGIGQLSGFSSKSNFFAIFKAETGVTPLEYQKIIQTVS